MHFLKAYHELSGSGDFSTEVSRLNQEGLHRLHSKRKPEGATFL